MDADLANTIARVRDYVDEVNRVYPSIVNLDKVMTENNERLSSGRSSNEPKQCYTVLFVGATKAIDHINDIAVELTYTYLPKLFNAQLWQYADDEELEHNNDGTIRHDDRELPYIERRSIKTVVARKQSIDDIVDKAKPLMGEVFGIIMKIRREFSSIEPTKDVPKPKQALLHEIDTNVPKEYIKQKKLDCE